MSSRDYGTLNREELITRLESLEQEKDAQHRALREANDALEASRT